MTVAHFLVLEYITCPASQSSRALTLMPNKHHLGQKRSDRRFLLSMVSHCTMCRLKMGKMG